MVAVAIVGAAVVGGAASMSASSKASKTAKKTAADNNALQREMYGKNEAALTPYMQAGAAATPAIQALLGLSGGPDAIAQQNAAFQNFRNSSGYQDQFAEGQRAVTGALGQRGLLDSGAASKALTKYGQGQANQSFGNYYNALAGQQGIGLSGASALAGVGQGYANAVSNNNNQAAETRSNAALANAGSINGILSSALSAYGLSQGMGSSYGGGVSKGVGYSYGGFG